VAVDLDAQGNPVGAATVVQVEVTETTFDVTIAVETAAAFDVDAYVTAMAEQSGADVAEVVVERTDFVVEVGFTFTSDTVVTADQAKIAIATSWGVAEALVTVVASRRLDSERRLADASFTASLSTTDPAVADQVKTEAAKATTADDAVAALAAVGVTATVQKTSEPTVAVKVTTKVTNKAGIGDTISADKLATIATTSGGTGATVGTFQKEKKTVDRTIAGGEVTTTRANTISKAEHSSSGVMTAAVAVFALLLSG
jgi:hypothetical protein